MNDDDPLIAVTLKRSEWECLIHCGGEVINKYQYKHSLKGHGHYFTDVWVSIKRTLRNVTAL